MMNRVLRIGFSAAAAALALAVSGCVSAVPMVSAEDANSPDCAQVTVHLPDTLNDTEAKRETDAQATGAWGSPTSVLLRCGVEAPSVSDLPCYNVQGIDWLVDTPADDSETAVLTTYGRSPAVEVILDTTKMNGATALSGLADAVGYLPTTGRQCTAVGDLPS